MFQDRCFKHEHPELDRALPTVNPGLAKKFSLPFQKSLNILRLVNNQGLRPWFLKFLELKKNEFKLPKVNRVQKAAEKIEENEYIQAHIAITAD